MTFFKFIVIIFGSNEIQSFRNPFCYFSRILSQCVQRRGIRQIYLLGLQLNETLIVT